MLELRSSTLRATFSPVGARLVSLFAPDSQGNIVDVAMGAGTKEEFPLSDIYAGAICGRVAGRIGKSKFPLDGELIELVPNEGTTHLHGGPDNFSNREWTTEATADAVRFTIHSPDGDQGYPGALDASAIYRINGDTLSVDLEARTTRATIVNLTNHVYWNLSGSGNALDHVLEINADRYVPLSAEKVPLGSLLSVAGTRWDFRSRRPIKEAYDNAFCVNGANQQLARTCSLRDPKSGRFVEIWSTSPVVQLYTADHWGPSMPGKSAPLLQYGSIALELQDFPDAPNHSSFPSINLKPGEVYTNRIEWRFGAEV